MFFLCSHIRMRQISPDEIKTRIAIQLRCLPGWIKTATGMRGDRATELAAEQIMERVFNGVVVIAPDLIDATPYGRNPGQFGVTETWPAGCEPDEPDRRSAPLL
ncbi:hypothetical protein [Sphingomonas nostoxanthinifaciens]|uniref:hypothetical protein n=1 Tax=Sphingomonas nostoxanthinifaciens TaxID=2872652 RepID=UPI001CC1E9FA|nr:hypothetical protein [Sphingomonas nostoxanthinifaciens]UAK23697.1 hypothetical protein K8P63_15095 [Sphingomonas nostoxanthinifaciens]